MTHEHQSHLKIRLTPEDTGPFVYDDPAASSILAAKAHVLFVACSFSMTRYSGPGQYNSDIRNAIIYDIETAKKAGANPFVFVQWEIADAAFSNKNFPRDFLPADHVCEPHLLKPDNIIDPRAMLNTIVGADSSTGEPMGILKLKLEELWRIMGVSPDDLVKEQHSRRLRERMAANLNSLLADQDFWQDFFDVVKLKDLHRNLRGQVWTELRDLPSSDHTVGKYQARRLGAFVLEAIFGDKVLRPTDYISTRSVLDGMMEQARQERCMPDSIWLYAHEAHAPRARWQLCEKIFSTTQDTIWKPDWMLNTNKLIYRGGTDRWGQCDNAQDWTDNKKNWNDYNGIEAAHS